VKLGRLLSLAAAGALLLLAPSSHAQTAAPRLAEGQAIPPAELAAFVDGLVEPAMARDHIAGVTVSVVQDGQVVFKRGYGMASLSPRRAVDPDTTLFRIGSISKTFTWIALMQQVEAGRMRLDAPVDTYLPPRLRTGPGPFGRPILVRDLMDHSPGFEDHVFGVLFLHDPARVRSLDDWLAAERPERVRPPGTVSSYSNYGAGLAGAAVAHVAGEPYERLVEQTITRPLGMAHTTFREPRPPRADLPAPMSPELAAGVSQAFHWTGAGYEQRPYEYLGQVAPAGSASSTAADMARYMEMILAGGALGEAHIYGPQAAAAFRTPVRPAPPERAWLHGFFQTPLPGGYMGFGHDGGTMSFFSRMILVPRLRLGVFVSTNTETGARLQGELARALVGRFYAAPQPFPPAGDPRLVHEAGRFAGHYLQTRRAYSGLEGFVHRVAFGADAAVTPNGYLTLGGIAGRAAYAPVGDPAQGRFAAFETGAPLAFAMKDGRAVAIPLGGATLERTGPLDSTGVLANLAGLTVLASLLTLAGAAFRPRAASVGPPQRWGGRLQLAQAVLWLVALATFAAFLQGAADQAKVVFDWPSPTLVAASALALLAAIVSLAAAGLGPFVWREPRWSLRRKAAYTLTALIALAFAGLLLRWGFLAPWSS
jgi:CubicO group peptidase (beta-lactamase class C family)